MVLRRHAVALTLAWGALAGAAHADAPASPLRVGGRPVSVLELERAIAICDARAPAPLGVPELARCLAGDAAFPWLLDRSDAAARRAASPEVRRLRDELLARALLDELQARAPPDEAARAEAERTARAELSQPPRIRIFRMLLDDEARARELAGRLGPDTTPADWRALCRENSVDRATHERGGDLGFVAADGTTDVPELVADPALFAAVAQLPDGAFAREPVREGDRFALVWRRGTLPAREADEERVRALAEQSARRRAGAHARDALLAELRGQRLSELHPERLELLRGAERMFPLR